MKIFVGQGMQNQMIEKDVRFFPIDFCNNGMDMNSLILF